MKLTDEHEMLIQYSEMTAFDFNSEEFQKVRDDYIECKGIITRFFGKVNRLFNTLRPAKSW